MTKQLRDARTLDEEAAAIRERARALHDASKNDIHKENTSWGARHDTMKQEATAARSRGRRSRQASERSATPRAIATRKRRASTMRMARDINADRPVEAEEYFEDAQGWVRMAEATSARAEAAREVAREWATKADELEQNLQSIDGEAMSPGYRGPQLERAADLLDDKARLLSEAAQKQRDSEAEYANDEFGAGSASNNRARYAQQQADTIEPDYSTIDPAGSMDAGVPRRRYRDPNRGPHLRRERQLRRECTFLRRRRVRSDAGTEPVAYQSDFEADVETAPLDAAAAGDMSFEYES